MGRHQSREEKLLDKIGKNEVQVRANGGFAVEGAVVSKTVSIEGENLISVPSLIELYVGETKSFDIDIFPFGRPNENYAVNVLPGRDKFINAAYSKDVSSKENRLTGLSPGEDTVEVSILNGRYKN